MFYLVGIAIFSPFTLQLNPLSAGGNSFATVSGGFYLPGGHWLRR